MTERLMSLTPEQTAAMAPYAQQWIRERGWRTTPLSEDEWQRTEDGIRACYRYAGLDEPKVIVRVPNPLVGALAAPAAALAIQARRRGAVDDAVDDAVDGAVDGAVRGAVRRLWHHRFGGTIWSGWYHGYSNFFRDIVDLNLSDGIWARSRAWDDANQASWWWPFRDFVLICDVPQAIHVERIGPDGWGSHQAHREDGPAIVWPGLDINMWHGTHVPADFFSWDIDRALAERNTEIRRCALERIGWDQLEDRLSLVSEEPDPGNHPHTIRLYEGDILAGLYEDDARILLVHNASPDKGGHRRRFGLPVPAHHKTAISAAADLFGVPEAAYRGLIRAS